MFLIIFQESLTNLTTLMNSNQQRRSALTDKVSCIRAAHCYDRYSAERAALSNNALIITIRARVIRFVLAKAIADAFLSNEFDKNGRSASNVAAINSLDESYRSDIKSNGD